MIYDTTITNKETDEEIEVTCEGYFESGDFGYDYGSESRTEKVGLVGNMEKITRVDNGQEISDKELAETYGTSRPELWSEWLDASQRRAAEEFDKSGF